MTDYREMFPDLPRRQEPDTPEATARRMHLRSQCLTVLRAYSSGRELIDHDAYRLAGFPPGRTSHQRCADLRVLGWIERTGARGKTPSGHSAWMSRITELGRRVLLNTGPRVE